MSFLTVQLWTVGNYHWYLKQSLPFEEDKPTSVVWDPEHAYQLHIVTSGGKYLQYTWSWTTDSSPGPQNVDKDGDGEKVKSQDQALVAVIDGGEI